jgi:ribosomal peptide maturation radical SAM protein 1
MSATARSAPVAERDERVLLVSMPFGALERPALSLGLLTAHCERLGIPCDTRYLTFRYADRAGLGNYLWLCSDEVPYTAFAGDWLFSEALYGRRPYADAAYTDEVLRREWQLSEPDIERLRLMRGHVGPFLEECLRSVAWEDYTLVGFTSVFQQNIASLALAERVKRAHPHVTIACGGANWEEAMGVALQREFPFVDLAFSGEADESFPAVIEARRRGGAVHGIPGVTTSGGNGLAEVGPARRVRDLDSVPIPDFSDFFAQMKASCAAGVTPTLLMETARGCWWGERSHCTFCGLNGATMAFRSKSPERVLHEITLLHERHHVQTVSVVDDILDMRYFKTVLPQLAEAGLGIEFFWEIKANLTHHQVRALRDAGITLVQPGIESFSDHVLKLMHKGTTGFRNIELMKWCQEYGVKPYWNFLYGFPGETTADYTHAIDVIEAIWHLDPPTGTGPVRLDRFSPYHADPAGLGMVNVRPMAPFTYLYPFEHESQMNIAYYFDFDYASGLSADACARDAVELVRTWMADGARGRLELRTLDSGALELLDTRPRVAPGPRRAELDGWKAAVYLACDRAQTLHGLSELPSVRDAAVADDELEAFLARCVENRLMVHNGRSWLGVAVHVPERPADAEPVADEPLGVLALSPS